MGSVVPYPLIPQAGLVGVTNPVGAAVLVTLVVKVAKLDAVDVPAQYPVP